MFTKSMSNLPKLIVLFCVALMMNTSCSSAKNQQEENEKVNNNEAFPVESEIKKDSMKNNTKILISTTLGDITIILYEETPQHRDNFIKLVNENYYDGVLFHRIIKEFMIQTGDPDSKNAKPNVQLGMGGPGYTTPAEFVPSLYHKRGAVAAARTGDQINPQKASSGSQFYIVDGRKWTTVELNQIAAQTGKQFSPEQIETYTTIGGVPFLDADYTVFGEVISGMEVVDKIASQPKDRFDRPTADIKILSTKIINE